MSKEADERRPRRRRKIAVFFVVLALLLGGLAYLAREDRVDVRGAVELAKETTEEAATTARVKAALALSRRVSAFDIDVDTQGGVVRLEGEVPSEEVRDVAVAIAEDTSGVVSVEDRLFIDPEARPSAELEQLRRQVRDLEAQIALRNALDRAPDLSEREIEVSVEDGVVTLSGKVDDPTERSGAERIASAVEGVRDVENQLEVSRAASLPPDDGLKKRAEFALFTTDAFNLELIEIRVEEGVVTLSGDVRSEAERLLAERVVADVDGVQSVENRLEVLALYSEA